MSETRRVIALGFFDGVHRAHGALLSRVRQRAQELGAIPCAFTFDCSPTARLTGQPVPLINSLEDREWIMRRYYGMEEILLASFDQMMTLPWERFITDYLQKEQKAVHVVAGHDFHFGYRGQGNPQRLQETCARLGIGCDIIPEMDQDGIRISSTHIRKLVEAGDMEEARIFLGHPHLLGQQVTPGKHLGHTLGFPTVNLQFQPHVIIPAHGVYACRVLLEDGTQALAVTNVGVRPTVEAEGKVNVEAFILDYDGDLYGQTVRVAFYHRLRGERKFPSVAALTEEVLRNAQQTRDYFAGHPELPLI